MIFVDRSVPRSVVTALRAVRDDVEWLEPRFPHDTPDPEWLAEAGKAGWLVITRDQRIRTRPFEQRYRRALGRLLHSGLSATAQPVGHLEVGGGDAG